MMWKKLDAFPKPREDVRTQSALGGIITIVAGTAAVLLFVGQIHQYVVGVTRHSLHLSKSHWVPVPRLDDFTFIKGRIPLHIHISFPHLDCRVLDLRHDGLSSSDSKFQKIHGRRNSILMRKMTEAEWQEAFHYDPMLIELEQSCSVTARYDIPKVGGSFSLSLSEQSWSHLTSLMMFGLSSIVSDNRIKPKNSNITHYIHGISFGDTFPLMEHNPMRNKLHVVQNAHGGLALSNIAVKLIPTKHTSFLGTRSTYQLSVTDHVVEPETLASQGSRYLPGLTVSYDFTPLTVHLAEDRESFLVFLSSLVSIVGGVFVTVSLITGIVVHSAAAVAKKID